MGLEDCGECECKTFEATEGETSKCNCGHADEKHKGFEADEADGAAAE